MASFFTLLRLNLGTTKQVFFFYFLRGCFLGYFPNEILKNRPLRTQQKLFQVQKLATITFTFHGSLRVNSGTLHQASLLFYFLRGCFPGRKVSLPASEVGLNREAVRARLSQFLVNTTFSLIGPFPRTKSSVNQGVYSKMDFRMIFNKTWFSLVCATEGRVTGRRSTLDWLMTDNQLLVLSFSIGLQWAGIISGEVF